jgi:hypothetical protein
MSKFEKGNLRVDGETLRLSMPFSKVNKEKRTVSGFATLDNIDSEGDVVTAEASAKAFARARGNVREMHEKIAAGRVVDFKENEYIDPDTGEVYRGIYVTAYVSKGAQSTWEKVLDGTLTGFSIGGEIHEASNEFVKDAGRTVRFIKDYDLTELSLVDNPANQLANIDSFTKSLMTINKSATGSVKVEGVIAETEIEAVFICKTDDIVQLSKDEVVECPVCENKMENAGWFETGVDRTEKVREIVAKFRNPTESEATPESTSEGGVEMFRKSKDGEPAEGKPVEGPLDPSETFPDGEKVDETTKDDSEETTDVDETQDTEEETAEVEEVEDDESKIEKMIGELHVAVQEAEKKTREETVAQITALEKKLDEVREEFVEKTSGLEEKLNKVGEGLETAKAHQAALQKSLELMNSSEAFRKSGDLDQEETPEPSVQESMWKGAFSGKRFSIDNHK